MRRSTDAVLVFSLHAVCYLTYTIGYRDQTFICGNWVPQTTSTNQSLCTTAQRPNLQMRVGLWGDNIEMSRRFDSTRRFDGVSHKTDDLELFPICNVGLKSSLEA